MIKIGAKATFDATTKIIQLTEAPSNGLVEFDIKIDLYSDGKEDWITTPNLTKLPFPLRPVGGDPITDIEELGSTFFLDPAWKIRPYEANHKLLVEGNFYAEDQSDPFIDTVGAYNIRIIYKVSALTTVVSGDLGEVADSVQERLSYGNIAVEYVPATIQDAVRKVAVGELDHIIKKYKLDAENDWLSPYKTEILYAWFDALNGNLIYLKEDG